MAIALFPPLVSQLLESGILALLAVGPDTQYMYSHIRQARFVLTFTCNPKAKSITENLPPGVVAENRPNLVTRVFKRQLHELLCDIKKRHILGKPTAIVYVIEFQKRGLPHWSFQ